MKRIIGIVLAMMMVFSLCGAMAYADVAVPLDGSQQGSPNLKGDVYVTKNPTYENTSEAGAAQFIAKAGNATSIKWYIANADGSAVYALDDAVNQFTGLKVKYSDDLRTITLSNIPEDLDEWQVLAMFEGQNGPVYTKTARIHISNWELTEQDLMAAAVWKYNHTCPYCGQPLTSHSANCYYYYNYYSYYYG